MTDNGFPKTVYMARWDKILTRQAVGETLHFYRFNISSHSYKQTIKEAKQAEDTSYFQTFEDAKEFSLQKFNRKLKYAEARVSEYRSNVSNIIAMQEGDCNAYD